jgi:ATP-dependent metalloprotease
LARVQATIVPRGHALGMVSQVPDKDEYSTTRQQMLAHIDVCMGGKAAEALIFGEEQVGGWALPRAAQQHDDILPRSNVL